MTTAKKRLMICVATALAAVLIVGGIFAAQRGREALISVSELLSLGERFLLELNYEQALVQFLRVIEIEPRNPQGYYGAARAYIGLGRADDAISILRSGIELTGDERLQLLLNELLGGEQSNAERPDDLHDEFEEVNLTGQPALTRQEFENAGLGEHLQELVGRYGITQEDVDRFFGDINRGVIGAYETRNDVRYPLFISTHTNIAVQSATGIVVGMSLFDRNGAAFDEPVLRFEFGMTLYEILNTLAVSNPGLLAAAENPTRENLLLYSEAWEPGFNTIADIRDSGITNEDGERQHIWVGIFSEELEGRSSEHYMLSIHFSNDINVNIHFNAYGGMRSIWIDLRR